MESGNPPAPKRRHLVARVASDDTGHEFVMIGKLKIPVIGYVNCTGHPLPGDAENARRIQAFLNQSPKQPSKEA